MKVAQLFEPFPNPKNSPLGQKKRGKNVPKIKSKSKVEIEEKIDW